MKKKENGCIEWTGAYKRGYGCITISDRESKYKYNCNYFAHRISYELFINDIPEGMWILHSCDNTKCVNPLHLYLGDSNKNVYERNAKNRTAKGERVGASKLKNEQVLKIKNLIKDGIPQRKIAKEFSVSQATINHINVGKTWVEK